MDPGIRLSCAIIHAPVPRRAGWLAAIERELGASSDPRFLGWQVVRDWDREGCWPTARRCWGMLHPDTTHHLVLADDVGLARGFVGAALRALDAVQTEPVGFYTTHRYLLKARAAGLRWVKLWYGFWGQAICLPVDMISRFLAWERKYAGGLNTVQDDTRVGMWAMAAGYFCWQTAPCLVEHVGDQHSLLGHTWRNRARWFEADASGLTFDDVTCLSGQAAVLAPHRLAVQKAGGWMRE